MSRGPERDERRDNVLDKGLKHNAIGFGSSLAIGLDATAPAYSLAAVIGIIVATVGLQAPAVLLVAFVPIFLTSLAFFTLNRVEPDCGTTFWWVTRAMGPFPGWIAGWAVAVTGILVIGSLAEVAAAYTLLLLGWDSAANSPVAVAALAVGYIALSTAVTVIGTELSGRVQVVMVFLQIGGLLLLSVVALARLLAGDGPDTATAPSLGWLNPLEIPAGALAAGLLTAVFIYWGWESAVNVNEETVGPPTTPGRAAIISTAILLATYLLVAFAVQGWLGPSVGEDYNDDIAVLADVAGPVLGSPLDRLVVLAVLTSALASTQTTILPASRTTLSMAARGAFPRLFGAVHPRFGTPWLGTILIGVLAAAWYVPLKFLSENFLFDTITALGLLIAFYYAATGYAAVLFFRHQITRSARDALVLGVLPLLGSLILTGVFVKAVIDFSDPEQSYSGELLGVGPPLVIGLGFLVLGVVGAGLWYLLGHRAFFAARPETVETAGLDPVNPP
jgi:amino acid transporter